MEKWPKYQPAFLGRVDYRCHRRVSRPHPSSAQTPQLTPVRTGHWPLLRPGSRLWAPCGTERSLWASAFNKRQVPPSFFPFLASFLSSKDSRPWPPLSVGYGFLPKHTLATGWGMSQIHRGPGRVVLCYSILHWRDSGSYFLENPIQGKVREETCLRPPHAHPAVLALFSFAVLTKSPNLTGSVCSSV